MNKADALLRLAQMTAAETDPVLSTDDLNDLLWMAEREDLNGNSPGNGNALDYVPNVSVYLAGQVVLITLSGDRFWVATSTGIPTGITFPDITGDLTQTTVIDGPVTWRDNGNTWVPTWDLNYAAAEGWRRKAGRVSNRFDFGSDNQTFSRSQFMAQCLMMADRYTKRYGKTLSVVPEAIDPMAVGLNAYR